MNPNKNTFFSGIGPREISTESPRTLNDRSKAFISLLLHSITSRAYFYFNLCKMLNLQVVYFMWLLPLKPRNNEFFHLIPVAYRLTNISMLFFNFTCPPPLSSGILSHNGIWNKHYSRVPHRPHVLAVDLDTYSIRTDLSIRHSGWSHPSQTRELISLLKIAQETWGQEGEKNLTI